MDAHRAVLVHTGTRALFGIEMILARFARNDLAVLGDLEALRVRFSGFDAHVTSSR